MHRAYSEFMQEYEELGHMNRINEYVSGAEERYYLPHHAVFKSFSSIICTHIVFDGSCCSSKGLSLNDTLIVGPTIQQDLYSIVLRFRTYQIVFTADIAKKYRQVRIHEEDNKMQRILWRRSAEEPLRTYELSTVTYGIASAPYLATRCLQQLAEDESKDFSLVPEILTNNFYVDDTLCGANAVEDALRLQQELIVLLGQVGFHLCKFCASHPSILEAGVKSLKYHWKRIVDKALLTLRNLAL